MGWLSGWVLAVTLDFDPWSPYGERTETSPMGWPLTSTRVQWDMHTDI